MALRGSGLLLTAVTVVLRFASHFYAQHRNFYSAEDKVRIDALISAATTVGAFLVRSIGE